MRRARRHLRQAARLAGGLAVAAATVGGLAVAAGPAAAAGSSGAAGGGSSGAVGGGSSAAASGANLGGFQLQATSSAVRITYEQPNFPIPATPTLELNLGYATSTFGSGPTGESNASVIWPGSVAASFGSQLGTFIDPYLHPLLGSHTPNLTLPPWPIQAPSSYPAAPNTPTQADASSQGVTMTSSTTAQGGSATSSFGSGGSGPGSPGSTGGTSGTADPVLPAGFVTVGSMGTSVTTGLQAAGAVASATATLHDVSIAGGVLDLKTITTTATATSDGTTGAVDGSTAVAQATLLGQAVTIGPKGISVAGAGAGPNLLGSVLPPLDQLLADLGIKITVGTPTDQLTPATAEDPEVTATRALPGVQIAIDATKFDDALNGLLKELPSSLQRQLVSQLPLAVPDSQVVHIDLGDAKVSAAASPAFGTGPGSSFGAGTGASSGGLLGASGSLTSDAAGLGSSGLGSSGLGGSGFSAGGLGGSGFSAGGLGSGSGTGLGSTGSTSGSAGGGGGEATGGGSLALATPTALFRGVGEGLVLLGVLAALALAAVLVRADRAVATIGAADDACPEGQG